jgi:lipoprotein-anchoring transpeptidase ErfK/SrfK
MLVLETAMVLKAARAVFLAFLLAAAALPSPDARAASSVMARIDLSDQRLYLYVDGRRNGEWPVSTARRGYRTPVGSFRPIRLERDWHSRKYDWAPMPFSIFFHGGYAIHGTTDLKNLGRPASHGCIRLHPDHAERLFNLVLEVGKANARIVITR